MKIRKSDSRLLVFCLVCWFLAPRVSAQPAIAKDSDPLHQLNNSVRALVRRVTPSVVQVLVTGYGPVEGNRGDTNLVLGKQQSIGSGVIIDSDGYIVTNAHVLRGAHRVQVNIPAVATHETPDGSLVGRRGRTVEAGTARILHASRENHAARMAGGLLGNFSTQDACGPRRDKCKSMMLVSFMPKMMLTRANS